MLHLYLYCCELEEEEEKKDLIKLRVWGIKISHFISLKFTSFSCFFSYACHGNFTCCDNLPHFDILISYQENRQQARKKNKWKKEREKIGKKGSAVKW